MIRAMAKLPFRNTAKFNLNSRDLASLCQTDKAPKYNIRIAYPPDYKRVFDFMVSTFMRTEPSTVNAGGGLVEKPCPVMMKILLDEIRGGMTLLCEDFVTKEVAGAAVNIHGRYSDIEYQRSMAQCCQNPKAQDVLNFFAWCSEEADPWNKLRVADLFECCCVAVGPSHARQGIAKRLVEESWILARDLDFRLFRIDASSMYTAVIAKSYGWKSLWSSPYRRYRNEHGDFVFQNIQEPHTVYEIFVDDLSQVKGYRPKKVEKK